MISFQRLVFFFHSSFFDIFGNDVLGSMLSDGVHKVTLTPKLSAPKLLFHFGAAFEDLPGYDALYHRDNLCYAVRGNALNQKMNMVLVDADLQKPNLVPFFNSSACLRQSLVHRIADHNPAVFRATDQMVQKNRYVMTLMYKFAILWHRVTK